MLSELNLSHYEITEKLSLVDLIMLKTGLSDNSENQEEEQEMTETTKKYLDPRTNYSQKTAEALAIRKKQWQAKKDKNGV